MPPNTRTRYLPTHGVVIEHPVIMDDATLAGVLIAFGQQLLASRPAPPAKTAPDNPKLPPKGRRR
jgi:hypothetical protein